MTTPATTPFRVCGPMKHVRSLPVPASLYENTAYPSRFRPRISRHVDVADAACWEACDDFERATGRKLKADSVGCINPVAGNVNALWFPEAIPERLRIISYLSELLFRHDGRLVAPPRRVSILSGVALTDSSVVSQQTSRTMLSRQKM